MIIKGREYRHNSTGNIYLVIGKVLLKIENMWVDGVSYKPKFTSTVYVRTEEDFINNFKEVEHHD